jgi:hypothetical protein
MGWWDGVRRLKHMTATDDINIGMDIKEANKHISQKNTLTYMVGDLLCEGP